MGSSVVKESTYPIDFWRAISFYLPVNYLALNKLLLKIYDESWFQYKLNLLYQSYDKHDKTYEYLHRRALKSGTIEIISDHEACYRLPIHGVKTTALFQNHSVCLILTFDNNLYSYNKLTDELKFIDSEVKDINEGGYIKKNECHTIEKNPSLLMKSDDEFLSTINYFTNNNGLITNMCLAVTKNKVYFTRKNNVCSSVSVKFTIKNITCYGDKIILQSSDGGLYFFYWRFSVVGDLYKDKVKNILGNYMQTLDNIIYDFNNIRLKDIENGNLRAAVKNTLLIEDKLYSLSKFTAPILVERNVKNIGRFCVFGNIDYIIR